MNLRLVTVSTLFPNRAMPSHGVFVETRLRHLVADEGVASVVLAPVAWLPPRLGIGDAWFGDWARHARAPIQEERFGLDVRHPRYLAIPKIGQALTPHSLYRTLSTALARLIAEGYRPDAIDAHYLYPDGVAAARLARAFALPLVITARGSDVTLWPEFAQPRRLIQAAIGQADGLITVSDALGRGVIALGADPAKVTTLRNGVDIVLFKPIDRDQARAVLGIARPYIVSVGHLIPRKGHDRVIEAFALRAGTTLAGHDLLIVGGGPERERLTQLAQSLGLAARVRLVGAMPQPQLPFYYSGADCLVLASSREGWANVLLEAIACGTPVVASPAAGNDEVVRARSAGLVAVDFTPPALAAALDDLLRDPPDRSDTRDYAEAHGWRDISAGQRAIFDAVISRRRLGRVPAPGGSG